MLSLKMFFFPTPPTPDPVKCTTEPIRFIPMASPAPTVSMQATSSTGFAGLGRRVGAAVGTLGVAGVAIYAFKCLKKKWGG